LFAEAQKKPTHLITCIVAFQSLIALAASEAVSQLRFGPRFC